MIDTGVPTLAQILAETDYPATRDDLLRLARRADPGGGIASALEALPNRSFNGRWDVNNALQRGLAQAG